MKQIQMIINLNISKRKLLLQLIQMMIQKLLEKDLKVQLNNAKNQEINLKLIDKEDKIKILQNKSMNNYKGRLNGCRKS